MARGSAPAALWFIVCLFVSIALMAAPLSLKQNIAIKLGPIFFYPASRATALIGNVASLLHDNRTLRGKIAQQVVDQARLAELVEQNERLRKMLSLRDSVDYDLVAGLVVARPGHFGGEYFLIDSGSESGLKPDQGVISIEGLVGTVVDVESHRALIRTLLNTETRVSVVLARTGAGGILSPDRTGMLQINDIPIETGVIPGDTVVTSGFGGIFPPNLKVGRVVAVDADRRLLVHRVKVRPLVHFSKAREVFVFVSESNPSIMQGLNTE